MGGLFFVFGKEVTTTKQENAENRFTDAEMELARSTDLPDLLTTLGYTVTRIGSYHSTKEMDSLRIKNRRTWFRYSEGTGGDAITFLQRFCGKSFVEAVEHLLAYHGRARDAPGQINRRPKAAAEEEKVPFALPEPNADNRRVFAYLRKRGIAPQVINAFIGSSLLYEDAEHHNCVFVGKDSMGKPVFASKRGTYDQNGAGFRGGVPGSDKDIGFRLPCDPTHEGVYVFEAPIDLMSACTMNRNLTSNAVALCCLYDGPLKTFLQENHHIRHITLCLDNDEPGRKAADRMMSEYARQGYAVSIKTPAHGKDWNEYLQQKQKNRERGR